MSSGPAQKVPRRLCSLLECTTLGALFRKRRSVWRSDKQLPLAGLGLRNGSTAGLKLSKKCQARQRVQVHFKEQQKDYARISQGAD